VQALDLSMRRDLGDILATVSSLYVRHFFTFAAIALAVVLPMDLITLGLIDGYLSSGYDDEGLLGSGGIAYNVTYVLVTVPLITAGHVHAVMDAGEGKVPSARRSLGAAGGMFVKVALTVLLYSLGTFLGFIALVIPGIYLMVRWYFAAQDVVAEGSSPADALEHSGDLVKGNWWRVFGCVIVFNILAFIPALILGGLVALAASAANSGVLLVLSTAVVDAVVLSFLALSGTILYFDLRARRPF